MYQEITVKDFLMKQTDDDVLVDLRDARSFKMGTIPGAVHIPLEDISKLYVLPKDKKIYLFCQMGEVSIQFAELLDDAGYEAYSITGGYRSWLKETL